MADDTTTVPEAGQTPAPVEHTAAPADPNSIEHALEVLAEEPAPAAVPAVGQPKDGEVFEPLGSINNCP
ncbi:hypothetical protein ACIQBJ_21955 [Kitasatospora sp. NPDC088391]|uniref:hypothetical protein n=1 Tax=Kitasatospora sp. NPDC088391 TaxID=3364074 RepID=UPI00381B1E1F